MPRPSSSSEFVDLVRNSGLVAPDALADCLHREHPVLPDTEPARVAGTLIAQGLLTSFQAEQILQGKWRRFTIGSYWVLEKISAGNMGSVYLCVHATLQRVVAVKVLPTALNSDEISLKRFLREARALAACWHPNIARALEVGSDDNLHYIAMEYVEGANLHDIVKRVGPLDATRAAHYLRQAALGLHCVHDRGIIHRDIEPANLVVDRGGTLKIVDFGLAKCIDDVSMGFGPSAATVFVNPKYIAPEYANDNRGDARSDIYSLGATFYFCLAGRARLLFGDDTPARIMPWHLIREPQPIQELRPEVPDGLAAVIHRMLAKAWRANSVRERGCRSSGALDRATHPASACL
jgi:eukaryotic-like serine/threonine-protein kinase